MQMMQYRYPENEINRFVCQRDVVRGSVNKADTVVNIISHESFSSYLHDWLRDVHRDYFGVAAREQDAALAGATAKIKHSLAADIAEQVMRILERENRIRLRVQEPVNFAVAVP